MEEKQRFLRIDRGPGKRQIKPTAVAFEVDDFDDEDSEFDSGDDENETDSRSESDADDENGKDDDEDKKEETFSTMDASELVEDSEAEQQDDAQASTSDVVAKSSKQLFKTKEDGPPLCRVCLKPGFETFKIFKCVRCKIFVHDYCYGITEENKIKDSVTGELDSFLCEPCLFGLKEPPYCELCPSRYGALKKTDIGSNWVHVLCGLYVPNITYACIKQFIGISYQEVDHKLFGKKQCDGCEDPLESRTGIVVSCEAGLCKLNYHTTCAQRLGLLVEYEPVTHDENENESHGHLLCKRHSNNDIVKLRKRMYSKMMEQEEQRMIHIKKQKINEEYFEQLKKQLDNWRKIIDNDEYKNIVHPGPKTPKRIRMFHSSAEFMDGFALKAEMVFAINREKFGEEMTKIPTEKLNLGEAFSFTNDSTRHFDHREDVLLADVELQSEELKIIKKDVLQKVESEKKELAKLEEITDAANDNCKQTIDLCSDFVDYLTSFGARGIKKDIFRDAFESNSKPMTNVAAGKQRLPLKAALNSKVRPSVEKKDSEMTENIENLFVVPQLGSSKDFANVRKRSYNSSYSSASEISKVCFKCKNDNDENQMLFCDTCKNNFHISCLDPPLTKMPKKSAFFTFQCSDCFDKLIAAKNEMKELAVTGPRSKRPKRR